MKTNNINILLNLTIILLIGCATESMEFTTAKTALRSEKDFVRAEEWFKKALAIDSLNAMVPYIYAIDILRPQKRYAEMEKYLNKANTINANQKLETPFIWNEKPVFTVQDGVQAYKEQEWNNIYNEAVDNIQKNNLEKSIMLLQIAIRLLPSEGITYSTLGALYLENQDYINLDKIIKEGLKIFPENVMLLQISADYLIKQQEFYKAEQTLIKALKFSDKRGPILKRLIQVQVDLKKYESAIKYSEQATRDYPNDPDIYYNVAVLYQNLGVNIYNETRTRWDKMNNKEKINNEEAKLIYDNFKLARNYFSESKEYFLEATDLNPDDETSFMEQKK